MLVAMGADRADGRVDLKRGRLRVRYERDGSPVFARGAALFRRSANSLAARCGFGGARSPCTRSAARRWADAESDGVVDGRGEVFGYPGLFVVDAAALPGAPGGPPSMTIAAWSSWVAQRFLEDRA
jgi:cholesterol oxidase